MSQSFRWQAVGDTQAGPLGGFFGLTDALLSMRLIIHFGCFGKKRLNS